MSCQSIDQPRRLPWPSSRIERDVLFSLQNLARQQGRLTTDMVAEAVAQYLDREENPQIHSSAYGVKSWV